MRIDSHLHHWENPAEYAWMADLPALCRPFSAEESRANSARFGFDRAVLVQAADSDYENEHLFNTAAQHEWVAGVVAWLDLKHPKTAASQLQSFTKVAKFVGVRELIHDQPDPHYLLQENVRASLRLLQEQGVPLDVPDIFPHQINAVLETAKAIPELTIVVDHLAKPPHFDSPGWQIWQRYLQDLAGCDNVVAKVSGLYHGGKLLDSRSMRAAFDLAIRHFGADRLMFGSDAPIALLGDGLAAAAAAQAELLLRVGEREHEKLVSGTATRVYGLQL